MKSPFFFGYGSLVNARTHAYEPTRPAVARGWRRLWRHTSLREVAYLTVHESEGSAISGLIAAVPYGDWAALDEREHAYDRLPVHRDDLSHEHPEEIDVHIYKTRTGNDAPPSTRHPILMSYLDTVIAGYHTVFGREGVADFFATTDGWDSPVLDDRHAPIYARAITPTEVERHLVDTALDELRVHRFRPNPTA